MIVPDSVRKEWLAKGDEIEILSEDLQTTRTQLEEDLQTTRTQLEGELQTTRTQLEEELQTTRTDLQAEKEKTQQLEVRLSLLESTLASLIS